MNVVLINPRGGALRRQPQLGAAVADRARDHDPAVQIVDPGRDIRAGARRAIARGATLLVACGGDGTVGAVASAAADGNVSMGVVPLGTRNHFARDLAVPFDVEAAVDVAFGSRERRVDLGRVAGRDFVNNCSLGLYPELVSARTQAERAFGDDPFARIKATPQAVGAALRAFTLIDATVTVDDDAPVTVATPLLFVGNNRYEVPIAGSAQRARLDGGVLSVLVARAPSALALISDALELLLAVPEPALTAEYCDARRVRVELSHPFVRAGIDGEVADLPTPLEFVTRPGVLRVRA